MNEAPLARASVSFGRYYPTIQEFQQVQIQIGPGADGKLAAPATTSPSKQYRRSGNDEQELVILTPISIVVSQLAPYCGWDLFFKRFQRDWLLWLSVIGRQKVVRIGLRYINRIDIPAGGQAVVTQGDYIKIGVQGPTSFGPTINYAVQAIYNAPSGAGKAIINTSVIPLVIVPNFVSFNIDIDVGRDNEAPQSDKAIFECLNQMRDDKNFLFEEMITDKARELFQ
jgi:uncharacterized protein (TIGR04255 family)